MLTRAVHAVNPIGAEGLWAVPMRSATALAEQDRLETLGVLHMGTKAFTNAIEQCGEMANSAKELVSVFNSLFRESCSEKSRSAGIVIPEEILKNTAAFLKKYHISIGDPAVYSPEEGWVFEPSEKQKSQLITTIQGVLEKFADRNSDQMVTLQGKLQQLLQQCMQLVNVMNVSGAMEAEMGRSFLQGFR